MRSFILLLTLLMASPALADELVAIRTVSVTGQAERKVAPDQAEMRVNLNAMNAKLATARVEHDKKLKKLLAIAKDLGIPENKLRTESASMTPVYRWDNNNVTGQSTRTLEGYRVQTIVTITIADLTKVGTVMDQVMGAGFEQGANAEWGDLISMQYGIANPDKVREDLLAAAIANAKSKATRMASASGDSLGRVWRMQEGNSPDFSPRPIPMMAMRSSAMAADSAPVAPPAGETALTSTVSVTYELK
jgi:uncharacterized protein YggE